MLSSFQVGRTAEVSRPVVGQWLALFCCAALFTAGCGTTSFIRSQRRWTDPVISMLPVVPLMGRQPSDRTTDFLRRTGAGDHLSPKQLLQHCRLRQLESDPDPESFHAAAEILYLMADATMEKDPDLASELYYDAARASWTYFNRTQNDGLPIDPAAEQYRFTAEIYNHSVQNLLRLMVPSAEFAAGVSRRMPVTGRVIRFEVATPTKLIPADFCGHYEFVNEFRLINIRKRHARSGLGTPVIVDLTATHRHGRLAPYYTARMTAASTILLSFSDSSPGSRSDSAALRIYDTRETEDALVGRNLLPLERDLTTPLARQLSNPDMGLLDTVGLLRPDLTESLEGLYMLEPFDPQRIPVLMVHGFWSNPLAWTQMFNDLIATPEIRQRYQFWFYLYPTGEPLPIVAARMRRTLEKMRGDCDPHRTMPALDQMVVAGHSMGGILGHMLTIDSGDELWDSVSSKPIDSLPLSATLRHQLEDTWFFKANPSVKRLITIATPYGGTTLSNRFTRSFLRTVTWLPTRTMRLTRIALRLNKSSDGFVKSLAQTSIDSLARDSAVLALVQSRPVPDSVHHDNIIAYQVPDLFHSPISFLRNPSSRVQALTDGVVRFPDAIVPGMRGYSQEDRDFIGQQSIQRVGYSFRLGKEDFPDRTIEAGHSEVLRMENTSLAIRQILQEHWSGQSQSDGHVRTAEHSRRSPGDPVNLQN